MAKGMYVGVSGVAKKVKKAYVGVGGVAKKVKKIYVGVNGVAKLCYTSGPEIVKVTSPSYLPIGVSYLAGTSIGNGVNNTYAIFGGGNGEYSVKQSAVYTYNSNLTRGTAADLSTTKYEMAVGYNNAAAIFAGGYGGTNNNRYLYDVESYNSNLTKTALNPLTTYVDALLANTCCACSQSYVLVAGGYTTLPSATVNAYNTSLTQQIPGDLSIARCLTATAYVGQYHLFAGGYSNRRQTPVYYDNVDAYNSSLTRSSPTALSATRGRLSSGIINGYALFAGGYSSGTYYNIIDTYNTSLTRSSSLTLSVKRYNLNGVSLSKFVLFGGGRIESSDQTNVVDVFDTTLTRSVSSGLSLGRENIGVASVGNSTNGMYAIFAGGYINGDTATSPRKEVDAYKENF